MTGINAEEARPVTTAARQVTDRVTTSIESSPDKKCVTTELDQIAEEKDQVWSELVDLRSKNRGFLDEQARLMARINLLTDRAIALKMNRPACFGTRTDLDLPECESCRIGALCFREMKAKGLI